MIVRGIAKRKITNKFRNGFVKLMKNRSFGNCKLKSPRWNLWNSKSPKLGFEDIGKEVEITDRLFFPMGTLHFQLCLTTVIGCHQKKYTCVEKPCVDHMWSVFSHPFHCLLYLPFRFSAHLKFFSKGFFLKVALGIHPAMIRASIVPNVWRVRFRKTYPT